MEGGSRQDRLLRRAEGGVRGSKAGVMHWKIGVWQGRGGAEGGFK